MPVRRSFRCPNPPPCPNCPKLRSPAAALPTALPARVRPCALGKPLRWPLGCDPAAGGPHGAGVRGAANTCWCSSMQGLLLLHLGMSGSLQFAPALPPRGPHDHFELAPAGAAAPARSPPLRRGGVRRPRWTTRVARKLLGGLGWSRWSRALSPVLFHRRLQARRSASSRCCWRATWWWAWATSTPAKALFMAGIRPTVRADRLSRPRAARLHAAIVAGVAAGAGAGRQHLRDFSSAEGQSGYFQLDAMVYGRAGLPCRVCGTPCRCARASAPPSFARNARSLSRSGAGRCYIATRCYIDQQQTGP
jgi:formamidopyrimidine-DNA glycosylase